ncbi:MAG: tripartite tricarboxylate transporter TctB family protein [Burkholderiales bacterium]
MAESQEPAPRGLRQRTAEIVVALGLIALGGTVVIDSRRLGAAWGDDGPQSGYFPFYIGLIVCLSAAIVLGQALRLRGKAREALFVEWAAFRQVLAVLVPAVVYVLGVQLFGIYLASAVYICVFMVWLGKYPWWKGIATGTGVAVVLFMMFEVWFKVPLAKGTFDPLSFLGY